MRVNPVIKDGVITTEVYCYTGDRNLLMFAMHVKKPASSMRMLRQAKEEIQGRLKMALSEECMVKCSHFNTSEDFKENRPNNDSTLYWKASGTAAPAQNPYFVKF